MNARNFRPDLDRISKFTKSQRYVQAIMYFSQYVMYQQNSQTNQIFDIFEKFIGIALRVLPAVTRLTVYRRT